MAGDNSERTLRLRHWWREHGWAILLYLLLSIGYTWPMAAHFTSQIPGTGYDAYNGIWVMWHTKEAVLGNQPFFDLPTLYYPHGATLLTHVPGLTTGFFALPFWSLGPEAAHNSAVLISFILTGYFTYLLGRTLGLDRASAFLAGLLLLAAPMHLLGLQGHTTKVFLGAAPLVLLCLFRTLDLGRSQWSWGRWAITTALALLFAILHDSFQFLTAGAAVLLVALYALLTASRDGRIRLLQRLSVVILASLMIVGPLVVMTAKAAYNPEIIFDLNAGSFEFQPDVSEFVIPSTQSRLLEAAAAKFFNAFDIGPNIETAIYISFVAYLLMLAAAVWGKVQARFWLVFTLIWMILSVGPTIRFLNQSTFTEYGLPIIMPYAFLTELPGLDFLRTPGRFMQIGFMGVGIAAAFGLALVRQHWPRQAAIITIGVFSLVLLESWPQPWQMITLRTIPEFYQQIAGDEEMYGVLDIPVTFHDAMPNILYNATYQIYQIYHSKGIPMGYISRTYHEHPLFPCLYDPPAGESELRINGRQAPCPFHPLYDLPLYNYRYVVVHKPQPENIDYVPGTPGEREAAEFIAQYLGNQTPIIDDALTTVYEMPPAPDASALMTTVGFVDDNWHGLEVVGDDSWRWAQSPAELILTSPITQNVVLEMMIYTVYIPPNQNANYRSRLQVETDTGSHMVVEIEAGKLVAIPLTLSPGKHILTLNLEAGNFQPSAHGGNDPRFLSFAVRYLNLRTTPLSGDTAYPVAHPVK
jgi:hypothetical protein